MSTVPYLSMNEAFLDYYRCPGCFASFELTTEAPVSKYPGYFTFGPGLTCFGRSTLAFCPDFSENLPDAMQAVQRKGVSWSLPFNPTEVADNLRYERYVGRAKPAAWKRLVRSIYYALRPALSVAVRRHLQGAWLKQRDKSPFPRWPVDRSVDQIFEALMRLAIRTSPDQRVPFVWFWPDAKSSCAIMTHDVETNVGLKFTDSLMDINDSFNIRSSFQLIPDARYTVTPEKLAAINRRGFEVNVHDLKHDGHLFDTHQHFQAAAERINNFAVQFGSRGFRSGVLYRNQAWFDALRVSYDMSVPNVANLDPQTGGCCTVMPYFIGKLLEIPVTATQDYSLFHVLATYSQDLWNDQIHRIIEHHGLVSFIVHPDYLNSPEALGAYTTLLGRLSALRLEAGLWICLPRDLDCWWRQRSEMKLVAHQDGWKIEGAGAERARVAYAVIHDDQLHYTLA